MERPKLEVADVFRRYGAAYRQQHAGSLSRGQRRVMSAIELCRTAALGGHLEECDCCGHPRPAYHSCPNRHCPKCQSLARAQWLADRQAELLPVEYFHVVFTLPEEIAAIAYQNKEEVYGILFRATAETLRTIAADPQHRGAEIGFFAVLHSWGQNLLFHPHMHCVVPGGGLAPDGKRWISCRPGFFCPSACCLASSDACSSINCRRLLTKASCTSFPPWSDCVTPTLSPNIWLRFAKPSGS